MMRWLTFGFLTLVALIAFSRATLYVVCIFDHFRDPSDIYFLESQMVHLSYRVELGELLYPEWRDYPHVANVFGPLYFWMVGGLGRLFDADLHSLRLIGRGVSIACVLASSFLLAWILRRHGAFAALIGAAVAFGSPLLFGFGFMVRSDTLAELLGFAGFLAAVGSVPAPIASVLLASACLARQPAGVFLIAAVLALCVIGNPRRAVTIGCWSAGLLAGSVGVMVFTREPNALSGMLLEGSSPKTLDQFVTVFGKFFWRGLDLIFLTVVAFFIFFRRNPPVAVLALTLALSALLLSSKVGSDLNYYLPLRLVAGWTAGELVALLSKHARSPWSALSGFLLAGVILIPAPFLLKEILIQRDPMHLEKKALFERNIRSATTIAQHNKVLSDVDEVLFSMGLEAPFVDPFLFRMLVETDRIDPKKIIEAVEQQEYDYIVTRMDMFHPDYLDTGFGLPEQITLAARKNYQLWRKGALWLYRPLRASNAMP